MDKINIVIPALGGFGDVVSGIKIGEALSEAGYNVSYDMNTDTREKAKVLFHEMNLSSKPAERAVRVEISFPNHGDLHIATLGRYRIVDYFMRSDSNKHQVSLRPGFIPAKKDNRGYGDGVGETEITFDGVVPTVYTPYRAAELPVPGDENIRNVIIEATSSKYSVSSEIISILEACSKIGVCYMAYSSANFIDQLASAAMNYDKKVGIVVLADETTESQITYKFGGRNDLAFITHYGEIFGVENAKTHVIFLENQPQTLTTRLFWASELPVGVTGEHSLFDAVYGLTYGRGQGFFYELLGWNYDTMKDIESLIRAVDPEAAKLFLNSANCFDLHGIYPKVHYDVYQDFQPTLLTPSVAFIEALGNTSTQNSYAEAQREAFTRVLRRTENGREIEPRVQAAILKIFDSGILDLQRPLETKQRTKIIGR